MVLWTNCIRNAWHYSIATRLFIGGWKNHRSSSDNLNYSATIYFALTQSANGPSCA